MLMEDRAGIQQYRFFVLNLQNATWRVQRDAALQVLGVVMDHVLKGTIRIKTTNVRL